MNDAEAVRLCGITKEPGEAVSYAEVISGSEQLYERYRKPIFITRAQQGSVL